MAYSRGNLAIQERQNETVKPAPRYREKTKVVVKRTAIPMREKLLYLLTVIVFVAVAAGLIWRYVHIYDLNKQAQQADRAITETHKQISVYKMEKQMLEQQIVEKAERMGYVRADDANAIHIPSGK